MLASLGVWIVKLLVLKTPEIFEPKETMEFGWALMAFVIFMS
jgi:hypothetical protein